MRYTKELLENTASKSISISDMCRQLGVFPKGATWSHLKSRLEKFDVDTSHFLGKSACAGARGKGKSAKLTADQILTCGKKARERPHRLRRALIEIGRTYACVKCDNPGEWRGQPMVLEVDHKNGDWSDCRSDNLEFMCPNCHNVKTYGA